MIARTHIDIRMKHLLGILIQAMRPLGGPAVAAILIMFTAEQLLF